MDWGPFIMQTTTLTLHQPPLCYEDSSLLGANISMILGPWDDAQEQQGLGIIYGYIELIEVERVRA